MKIQELIERVKLAWRILRSRDDNLVAHARTEFAAAGYGDDEMNRLMASDVVDLVRVFSAQGHSGFSASFCRKLFDKVVAFKPLGPLTGADSEWFDHGTSMGDKTRWQNKRCGHVFKDVDGQAYDIDAVVFEEPDGCRFSSYHSRRIVTFPYTPRSVVAKVPNGATEAEKEVAAQMAWVAA